jgi:Putative peptidoglycan binding domain/CHAP domain
VLDKAGLTELQGVQNECGSAYCPYIEKYYRQQSRWQDKPQVGAIVLFDWDGDGTSDHIGFVERVINPSEVITIEGNTSATNNSNGGQVQRRSRFSYQIRGYGIPLYQGENGPLDLNELSYEDLGEPQLYLTSPTINGVIVKHVQKRLLGLGYSVGVDGSDSDYGSKTEAAVKLFQKAQELEVDGWVGRDTWTALFNV